MKRHLLKQVSRCIGETRIKEFWASLLAYDTVAMFTSTLWAKILLNILIFKKRSTCNKTKKFGKYQ